MSINWSKIYQNHKGRWVALKHDEATVVGHGKTAKEALRKAKAFGYDEPILAKVPLKLQTYVGAM